MEPALRTVLSEASMIFDDRAHAARLLAERLEPFRGQRPLVLAIPRGGVPMGRIVADALEGDLDVVLVRKLRAPFNPEVAIGSIDEAGSVYLDPSSTTLWTPSYLIAEKRTQIDTIRRRRDLYGRHGSIDPAGRVAIVLDDGLATGATMIAALRSLRARKPARLVAATAVAPPETVERVRGEADEMVCLEAPEGMYAIGAFFRDFAPVSDDEVVRILRAEQARHHVAS
jgi:putative phosphoribosyl transferase